MQSLATLHATHLPPPLQTPALHVDPMGALDCVGPWAPQVLTVHASGLAGASLVSATWTTAPWPSHEGRMQSPCLSSASIVPAGAYVALHAWLAHVNEAHAVAPPQSASAAQAAHFPAPSQVRPPPQVVPAPALGCLHEPASHVSLVHGSPSSHSASVVHFIWSVKVPWDMHPGANAAAAPSAATQPKQDAIFTVLSPPGPRGPVHQSMDTEAAAPPGYTTSPVRGPPRRFFATSA